MQIVSGAAKAGLVSANLTCPPLLCSLLAGHLLRYMGGWPVWDVHD